MSFRFILILVTICAVAPIVGYAQGTGAEYRNPAEERAVRRSRPLRESLYRMRVDRDKKDHDEMMARASEVLYRTRRFAASVESAGGVTKNDKDEIAAIEKLAKQILKQLGGDDGDYKAAAGKNPMSSVTAAQSLKEATAELNEELEKISRFTISTAAIQSSNEVLWLARYIRSNIK